MGVDIHMSIVNPNGEYIKRDIFDGRNSEWFGNLQREGWDDVYDTFCPSCGIPDLVPADIKEDYDKAREIGYYGFYHITAKEFKDWFTAKRPDIDAGWLSTYEKWLYDVKGVYPNDIPHYLDDECNPNDYHFVEVTNPYDCSNWLNQFLLDEQIPDDAYIVYYFDC